MKKNIQISIPTPCHEGWENMAPADKGRFCSSCQKTVIDFTRLSDREILQLLDKEKKLCGHIRKDQMGRNLSVTKEKNSLWVAASAAIVSFLTIGNHTVSAQAPLNTEQTENKTDDIKEQIVPILITGTVTDSANLPFPGINVVVKGTNRGVQTDYDGKYSIEVLSNDILQFSFIGFETMEIPMKNNNPINIVMKEDMKKINAVYDGGMVITEHKSRTFFGRVFHSIGNWFR